MTLIREVIQISGGYTDVVDLTNHYFDPKKNSELMERYKPIKAHRDAFENLSNALNQTDKRFYFLSGSYGTGKSHLCLMAANYFANPSNTLEMETFFKNYAQAQKDVKLKAGETLKEKSALDLKVKRKEGTFLVAICRYGLNLEFEGTILRAIEDALKGSSLQLNTHFKEAIRKIKEWESKKNERPFYNDLQKELEKDYTGWSIDDLLQSLSENKEEAYKIFKACHKEVTSADFAYNRDNLQDILKDILSNSDFKEKYKGLIIIFDEFGYALDDNLVNLKKMQEFAQFCATSNMSHLPVTFIGTGHKSFRSHGQVGDAVHYDTISARVVEIPLQTQGMEDIIGAIITTRKTSPIWQNEVNKHQSVFESFTGECNRLKLFNWLSAPIIENNIIQNIYPMHPLATYALLQLAKEVSSDNRSVYQFFSARINEQTGEWENVQDYSYPWFISNNQIIKEAKLNLFTADLLYDYFKDGIKTDNKKLSDPKKQSIKNYLESIRAFNKYLQQEGAGKLLKAEDVDDLFYKILKAILIIEIVSNDVISVQNTKENIYFALNAIMAADKDAIAKRLEKLCAIGVLYASDGIYDLRKSDVKDIQRIVDDYKADPNNHPTNLIEQLLTYVPNTSEEEYLEAKEYNLTYNEDKRLKSIFMTPEKLEAKTIVNGNEISIYERCLIERTQSSVGAQGYDGTAIYVFCQSDEEIEKSKALVKYNTVEEVVVAISKKPFNIVNDIQSLNAIDAIKASPDYKDFGTLENSQLNDLKKNALSNLRDIKSKWFDNKAVDWFSAKGIHEKVNDNKKHDIANKIVEKKYHEHRIKISHPDFNKSHINLTSTIKRVLNEAIEALMDLSQSIKIEWNLPENRGTRKYIQKCFVDNQVVKIYKVEGDFRYLECEVDTSKYKDKFPVYLAILNDIESIKGQGWQKFDSFIRKYYEQYGLGEIAIVLLFLLARRYYGDSIRIRKHESDFIDLNFTDASIPLELISLKYPNAVFQYEPISNEQKEYFYSIHRLFDPNSTEAGKTYGIHEAYSAAKNWWQKLSSVSKIEQYYNENVRKLSNLFYGIESADPFSFIKKDLMETLGYEQNELLNEQKIKNIVEQLKSFKDVADSIEEQRKDVIRRELKTIFNSETATDLDIVEAIRNWFNDDLDKYQKDQFADFHNNESKALIKKVNGINDRTEYLFKTLPDLLGLSQFASWTVDKTSDLINKVKIGKKHLEENTAHISELTIEIKGRAEINDSSIKHKGGFEIEVNSENTSDVIYYTEDGSDPSDEKNQRVQLKHGQKIPVSGNKTVKFVVKDQTGKYGKIKSYVAVDESQKCKATKTKSGFFGDEQISFIVPRDEKDVQVALNSVILEIIATNIITYSQLEKIMLSIIDEAKNKK